MTKMQYEVSYCLAGYKYVKSGTFDRKDQAIAAAKELFRDFVSNYCFVRVEIMRRATYETKKG